MKSEATSDPSPYFGPWGKVANALLHSSISASASQWKETVDGTSYHTVDDPEEDAGLFLNILDGEKLDVNFAIEDSAYDELLQLCKDIVAESIIETL